MRLSSARAHDAAVLLSTQGAVYIEVPKVACTSIKITLARLVGIDLAAVGGDPHKIPFPVPPPRQTGPALYPGLFSFAFVRNPWDRLASCYRDKILGETRDFTAFHPARHVAYCLARFDVFRAGMSFDEFVEAVATIPDEEADDHFRSQHTFVTNARGDVAIDFLGKFETLALDFGRVCERLGLPSLALPRVQAANTPKRYTAFYTPRTRDIVASRFSEDVQLFRYEFGSYEFGSE